MYMGTSNRQLDVESGVRETAPELEAPAQGPIAKCSELWDRVELCRMRKERSQD